MFDKYHAWGACNAPSIKVRIHNENVVPEIIDAGLELSQEFLGQLTTALKKVFDTSPADASLECLVKKEDDGFEIGIALIFSGGEIRCMKRARSSAKALQRALERVHTQLRQWKKDRFADFASQSELEGALHRLVSDDLTSDDLEDAGPRVLIVDDNPISIKLMESCLRQQGCKTHVVHDGASAVHEITREDYDLMILDWNMPHMNGKETLNCAQDLISYDASFRVPWLSNLMPVVTYSAEDPARITYPECENFEFVKFISKTTGYSDLKLKTSELLKQLVV